MFYFMLTFVRLAHNLSNTGDSGQCNNPACPNLSKSQNRVDQSQGCQGATRKSFAPLWRKNFVDVLCSVPAFVALPVSIVVARCSRSDEVKANSHERSK